MKQDILTEQVIDKVNILTEEIRDQICEHHYSGWNEICAQVTIDLPGIGPVGIELLGMEECNRYLEYNRFFVVQLYLQKNDVWKCVWSCPFTYTDASMVKPYIIKSITEFFNDRKRKERNMKRQKYRKGKPIWSLDELAKQDLVYWRDKITPRGWFLSWQLKMTLDALKQGIIYYAIRKENNGE